MLRYFIGNFCQGVIQKAEKAAIFKVTHSNMQLQSKLLKCHTGTGAKTSKTKTPETICKVPPNLKYYNY